MLGFFCAYFKSMQVTVSGFKYSDDDGNGQRASTLIQGTPPRVVLILDSSGSTTATFQSDTGATIPDFNNDGRSNTVIDGAVAATGQLLSYLVKGGHGRSKLGLIEFNNSANTLFDGIAETTTSGTVAGATPSYEVFEKAKALQARGGTNYQAGLEEAEKLITGWGGQPTNIIFISDGKPNFSQNGVDVAERLKNAGHNIQAFGVGKSATVAPLNAIDSDGTAYVFTKSEGLFDTLNGKLVGNVLGSVKYTEPGMSDVEIYVDINDNGSHDQGEPSTKTDSEGNYTLTADVPAAGAYEVREIEPKGYKQTEGGHTITVASDNQKFESINFGNSKSPATIPAPAVPLPFADFTPPYLTKSTIDGTDINLIFNEEISSAKGLIKNDRFRVRVNNKNVAVNSYTIDSDARQIDLELENAVTFRDKVSISYKDSTNDQEDGVVQDTAGNDMASFNKKKVENITGAGTVLSIEEAEADGRTIELTFSDSLGGSDPKNRRFKVIADGEKNKVKDVIIGSDRTSATLMMQRNIEIGSSVKLSYKDSPGDQKRGVFQNERGDDLATQKDVIVNTGASENSKVPEYLSGYGQFDEITMAFDEILKPGRVVAGLFKVSDGSKTYRVRKASVGKRSKEVTLDLQDDLPVFASDVTVSYFDQPGDQPSGVLQSLAGQDVGTITPTEIFLL